MYHYQRLRDLREDADLKQKQIAELLDMTTQQYSLYERGEREIPFHHVITLAKYYNVSIDYIAGLTNSAECK
ncbi:MAG: helix-turn-helix transcriptional regulator [Oscillospiraceae bacterium]|nr:helix-turn-helix transcriptional regulator [Oscillospiraceae bacterium]